MGEASADVKIRKSRKESEAALLEQVENGKNKHSVRCQFCPSKILNARSATLIENEFQLPVMGKKKNVSSSGGDTKDGSKYDTLKHFWQINDMYTFENICFSNTVGNVKYLACADCEIGPVGYHNMTTKINYIALARVRYDN